MDPMLPIYSLLEHWAIVLGTYGGPGSSILYLGLRGCHNFEAYCLYHNASCSLREGWGEMVKHACRSESSYLEDEMTLRRVYGSYTSLKS